MYTGADSPARVLCVAVKKNGEPSYGMLREAAFIASRQASLRGLSSADFAFDPSKDSEIQAIAEGSFLAAYQYVRFKVKA